MNYGERDTRHFFVVKSNDTVTVNKVAGFGDGEKFRITVKDNTDKPAGTTDIIDNKLISYKKCSPAQDIYYRKWTITAPTTLVEGETYKLYFYLENLYGFGMQDKWDKVVSSIAGGTNATAKENLMKDLKEKLDNVINGAGPIKDDFVVTTSGSGASTKIIISENTASTTYTYSEIDMLTHDKPYYYDLILSTNEIGGATYGTTDNTWGGKVIMAENTTTVRIKSGMIVRDMEHYFVRERGDRYDFTPNFKTNIINTLRADENATYIFLDIHYAYQDGQGKNYNSEKDLTFAIDTNNTTALTDLVKLFGANTVSMDSMGYIYDEDSWKANYWRLTDYFAAGNTANKDAWNGDGWLIFNFPAGKYAGKTIAPKYNNAAMATVSATGTTSFAIYSTTSSDDMGAATPVTSDTLDEFDTSKVEFAVS